MQVDPSLLAVLTDEATNTIAKLLARPNGREVFTATCASSVGIPLLQGVGLVTVTDYAPADSSKDHNHGLLLVQHTVPVDPFPVHL